MFELIIGIIIGAAFADFWRYLYRLTRKKTLKWIMNKKNTESGNLS